MENGWKKFIQAYQVRSIIFFPEPEVFKITNLEPNYGPESGGKSETNTSFLPNFQLIVSEKCIDSDRNAQYLVRRCNFHCLHRYTSYYDRTKPSSPWAIQNIYRQFGMSTCDFVSIQWLWLLHYFSFIYLRVHLHEHYTCRDEHPIVCQTINSSVVDKAQVVSVSWMNEDIEDEITEYTFTYKPNPAISSIYPNVTVVK